MAIATPTAMPSALLGPEFFFMCKFAGFTAANTPKFTNS
jgi:hypothetical protein